MTDRRPNPEWVCAHSEEELMLRKAVQGLRLALRAAVQLQLLQECSMRETAEALGISVSATTGRLFHAKKALQKSVILKLKKQSRFDRRIHVLSAGWLGKNVQTETFDRSTRSNHKKKGDEESLGWPSP